MNSTVGRFLSKDPVWHMNRYPYVGNNPVRLRDPNGLYFWLDILGGAKIVDCPCTSTYYDPEYEDEYGWKCSKVCDLNSDNKCAVALGGPSGIKCTCRYRCFIVCSDPDSEDIEYGIDFEYSHEDCPHWPISSWEMHGRTLANICF